MDRHADGVPDGVGADVVQVQVPVDLPAGHVVGEDVADLAVQEAVGQGYHQSLEQEM